MKLSPTPIASLLLLALCAGSATAQEHHGPGADAHARPGGLGPGGHRGPGGPGAGPRLMLDQRYHHDHYYPPRGYGYGALPGGSISVGFGERHFFYHGGVWFRPVGGRYLVVTPPLGVVVPLLPPSYATLWIGGAPYYYANGVYYAPSAGQGYTVVAPPPGSGDVQPAPLPAVPTQQAPDPVIYPRNGQTAAQTEADRQDCNRWATTQPSAVADAGVFQRAVAACMDARGYTVR